jgi:hypothetical protein
MRADRFLLTTDSERTVRIGEDLMTASGRPCTMRKEPEPLSVTGETSVIDPISRSELNPLIERTEDRCPVIHQPLVPKNLEVPQFEGEMFQTVFGHLNGAYTWDCDHVPSENEVREGLSLRVIRDCRRFRKGARATEIAAWHGGWTCEGIGIFSADICTSWRRRTRHLGRACVKVRMPANSGSRTWNGVAC